jgi:hypothetical protein
MARPSYKEIDRKIREAEVAVSKGSVSIINPVSMAADALDLDIDVQDLRKVLLDLFEEISPDNYVGQSPPQRSYETEIKSSELLAFRWLSRKLGCRVYLKFTIKGNRLWLVSLHETHK